MSQENKAYIVQLVKQIVHTYFAEEIADILIAHGMTFKTEPQTNADRIRSMSDEGLAVFFDGFSSRCIECAEYEKNESCPIYKEGRYCRPKDIMDWLQQPPKGE